MAPENVLPKTALTAQNLNTGPNAMIAQSMISPAMSNPSMNNPGLASAANDNDPETQVANHQDEKRQLAEALKLFAEHGMMAGKKAQDMALEASTLGKTSEYEHWHTICHKLDRKLAADLTNRHIDRSAG